MAHVNRRRWSRMQHTKKPAHLLPSETLFVLFFGGRELGGSFFNTLCLHYLCLAEFCVYVQTPTHISTQRSEDESVRSEVNTSLFKRLVEGDDTEYNAYAFWAQKTPETPKQPISLPSCFTIFVLKKKESQPVDTQQQSLWRERTMCGTGEIVIRWSQL